MKKRIESISRRIKAHQKRKQYVDPIAKMTGEKKSVIHKNMESAKKLYGTTYKEYAEYELYAVPVDQVGKVYENILKSKSKRSAIQEKSIENVMAKTGWPYKKTVKKIEGARKAVRISYTDYDKFDFHLVKKSAMQDRIVEIKEEKKARKAQVAASNRKKAIEEVVQETGWTYEKVDADMTEAQNRTGCAPSEYAMYKFYEMDKELQNELFLMDLSKKIMAKYDVDRRLANVLYNKESSNKFFTDYMRRAWCMNTDVSYDEFCEIFKDVNKVFYKPTIGHGGHGAQPFELTPENLKEVYEKIVSLPVGVVEQYVVQHSKMNEMSPTAVNTIRFVTISSETNPVTEDGEYMDFAYASLKMGGKDSVVDNLVGGGIVAAVDVETGKLYTNAVDNKCNMFTEHPVTGTTIKGFEIPYFEEAKKMVVDSIKGLKLQGYMGWDVAITENGPVLIEANLRPGVILTTMPHLISEKKGMKKHMEKYL